LPDWRAEAAAPCYIGDVMRAFSSSMLVVLAMAVLHCGGKAVVDPASSGGSGGAGGIAGHGGTSTSSTSGTSTSTSSGTSATGGTADVCTLLKEDLDQKVLAARSCDPTIYLEQCNGEAMIYDDCGCDTVANEHNPEAVKAALEAFAAWVDAGCGPYDCQWCPPAVPALCEATPDGKTGYCVSQVN
jgi:hypothetical protein